MTHVAVSFDVHWIESVSLFRQKTNMVDFISLQKKGVVYVTTELLFSMLEKQISQSWSSPKSGSPGLGYNEK